MPRTTYARRQNKHLPKKYTHYKRKSRRLGKLIKRLSYTAITTFCLLGLTGASNLPINGGDVELKIGIVQRFGEDTTQQLQLEPIKGDRLTLKFVNGRDRTAIATVNPVKLEVVMQAVQPPVIEERIVLGTYRSFETAEESANHWQSQGIKVEIAQPERWQVWGKREIYNTPLLRRLLLQSVQASGVKTASIETKVLQLIPKVSWVVNGNRYSRDQLEISTGKNLIRVNRGKKADDAVLYGGSLELQPNAYGTYTLINDVLLETYLRGVVPHEIGGNAPEAALSAQAIIARTYVLRNLRRFAIDGYQLCADTHCQVYKGLTETATNADKAVTATKGQILTYQNQLIDALYSSTTGGVTANFSDVWNGADRPYLKPVIDAAGNTWNLSNRSLADESNFEAFIAQKTGFNETGTSLFRWRKESSMADLTRDLQKFLKVKNSPYANFSTIEEIAVGTRSSGGRILKLQIKTDKGLVTLEKDEVRSAFGPPISTLFYLQPLNKGNPTTWGYAFVGGGLGHGVGLSQTGAQELAKKGWSTAQILDFYYPGTQIQMLQNVIKP